jgi:hypothetical protein
VIIFSSPGFTVLEDYYILLHSASWSKLSLS